METLAIVVLAVAFIGYVVPAVRLLWALRGL